MERKQSNLITYGGTGWPVSNGFQQFRTASKPGWCLPAGKNPILLIFFLFRSLVHRTATWDTWMRFAESIRTTSILVDSFPNFTSHCHCTCFRGTKACVKQESALFYAGLCVWRSSLAQTFLWLLDIMQTFDGNAPSNINFALEGVHIFQSAANS